MWITASQLVRFLPSVNPYHRPTEQSKAEFLEEKINDLESAIMSLGAERVAAFIAEPLLASGGVIIPPAGYHRRTWEVCQRHDVLYIR
ncbi:MAG: aminotransferase class III-fold pyridoxal phosphate-dependent enzyme [Candidatus Zeuxoniibacter abyssi]|nr:MAG: aminotransferase class III-fold pyridoxal phosphate-dependent enzyme [Candidatus Persebacteraceae bacterium AB1(2)]